MGRWFIHNSVNTSTRMVKVALVRSKMWNGVPPGINIELKQLLNFLKKTEIAVKPH